MHLAGLGFTAELWELFGEQFADVMYSQDVIRAYPYALKVTFGVL